MFKRLFVLDKMHLVALHLSSYLFLHVNDSYYGVLMGYGALQDVRMSSSIGLISYDKYYFLVISFSYVFCDST